MILTCLNLCLCYLLIRIIVFSILKIKISRCFSFSPFSNQQTIDEVVVVKSRATLDKYDDYKYFKEDETRLNDAYSKVIIHQTEAQEINTFLEDNIFKTKWTYKKVEAQIKQYLENIDTWVVNVKYITSAGNNLDSKLLVISKDTILTFKNDPTLLMNKTELNRYLKQEEKNLLAQKQRQFYDRVNSIIDTANSVRDNLIVKGSSTKLDDLIAKLFDRTVNSIKKIKKSDSEEWDMISQFISGIESEVNEIVNFNQQILDYYDSPEFFKIKETVDSLMSSQREFNEYINEKADSISSLFGTAVIRNTTENQDIRNYIRPYKKTITPFNAEVSKSVFASAENNPLDYIVKKFYPNKELYPDQIRNLQHLVEELETLSDAKNIIENYKLEYKQYLTDVPEFILQNDESGFYSRLGFANLDESVLTVEYRFTYTSDGGYAQKSFGVPMTEDTIIKLIKMLESKLSAQAFAKEQRSLMTKKLRESIKKRDDYTCCTCGNSTHEEPNLLLEIDHIIPVSKGGLTQQDNLQTLCWKCNRSKSNKILA